jgi:hypothetical protein
MNSHALISNHAHEVNIQSTLHGATKYVLTLQCQVYQDPQVARQVFNPVVSYTYLLTLLTYLLTHLLTYLLT